MLKTEFKVLMYAGIYVDMNLLEKGIYATNTPSLHDDNTTILDLDNRARMHKDINGNLFVSESYFENLNQCELVPKSLI